MRKKYFIYNNIMDFKYIIKNLQEKIKIMKERCIPSKYTKYLLEFIEDELIPFLSLRNELIDCKKLNDDKTDIIMMINDEKLENERLNNIITNLKYEISILKVENKKLKKVKKTIKEENVFEIKKPIVKIDVCKYTLDC